MLNVVRIADGIMHANKRIPVSEDTWRELARIKEAGQAYDRLSIRSVSRSGSVFRQKTRGLHGMHPACDGRESDHSSAYKLLR